MSMSVLTVVSMVGLMSPSKMLIVSSLLKRVMVTTCLFRMGEYNFSQAASDDTDHFSRLCIAINNAEATFLFYQRHSRLR